VQARRTKALVLRSGATIVALVLLALGPLYAGADYRMSLVPTFPAMRMTSVGGGPMSVPVPPAVASSRPLPKRVVRRLTVESGTTLGSLLAAAGLDARGVAQWTGAAATVFDLRRLRSGRVVETEHGSTGELAALRYQIDAASSLVLERVGEVVTARRETKPFTVEVRGVVGTVGHGFWADAVDAGAPPAVAAAVTRILGGDIDFRRIKAGDEFRVLYEVAIGQDDEVEVVGDVLAAQMRVRGRPATAIRFEDATGRAGYYAPDGDALGRFMLRYPVQFTRISSRFTHRRFHPILRRYRPHLGVDFAAPRGTPVRATADGRVVMAGWKRGMGRMVRLRHANGLETLYGHLYRTASGLRSGTRIRQGQIIGYVGSTGLATGNHLHYAVRRGGRYVNPLNVGTVPTPRLPESAWPAFAALRDTITGELDRLGEMPESVAVSLAPSSGVEG
jgi:murein DD-endopeptidase MepM/ murein hydrolase activator NlpD